MKISLILGSIRPARESEKPAAFFAERLRERGHEVDFLDLRDMDIPLFADTPEQMVLPGVQRLIASILGSDAVVAVFPEYNHTYSSALKNAMDYLRKRELLHRPLGLVGVSDGQIGGARAIALARASLPTIGCVITPTAVQVAMVKECFPDATTCTSEKVTGMMQSLITELEAYAPALNNVRATLTTRA